MTVAKSNNRSNLSRTLGAALLSVGFEKLPTHPVALSTNLDQCALAQPTSHEE